MTTLDNDPTFDAPDGAAPGSGLHVLVVDDQKVNQAVALAMLRRLGHTGVAADHGQQALELLTGVRFDAVFMDVQMPVMDGWEATRKIRAGEAGPTCSEIPIVALTGHASIKDRQECHDAGMNGYVIKPIDSVRIQRELDRLACPAI
jgi:CheY-like chemotaxis protein